MVSLLYSMLFHEAISRPLLMMREVSTWTFINNHHIVIQNTLAAWKQAAPSRRWLFGGPLEYRRGISQPLCNTQHALCAALYHHIARTVIARYTYKYENPLRAFNLFIKPTCIQSVIWWQWMHLARCRHTFVHKTIFVW